MKALIDETTINLMNRPYIYIDVAATVDGRISKGPNLTMWEEMADTRASETDKALHALSEKVTKELKAIYKPQADMLGSNSLVKAGTALGQLPTFMGDPKSLYQDFLPNEVINRPDRKGWLLVVDGQGRCRSGWQGGDPPGWLMLHLVSHNTSNEYLAFLQERNIPYLIAGETQVDLKTIMVKLKSKLGITCLKTSAAGNLGGALLRAGLIDEINIFFSPYLAGGFKTPALFDSIDLKADEPLTHLKLIDHQIEDSGHIWVRYQVIHQE